MLVSQLAWLVRKAANLDATKARLHLSLYIEGETKVRGVTSYEL